MIICSCNVLTDAEVRAALAGPACPRTPGAVYKCLGCNPNCGRCIATVKTIINEARAEVLPSESRCGAGCEAQEAAACLV